MPNNSKHTEASFFLPIQTDLFTYESLSPRSLKLVIFVQTTMMTTDIATIVTAPSGL